MDSLAAWFRRRSALLAVMLLLGMAIAPFPVLASAERILSFAAEITVAPEGTLHIVEEIEVAAEGREIRRGIFRDLPFRERTVLGLNRAPAFRVARIARDGRPEPYSLVEQPDGMRVYIGREDHLLTPGPYRYTIAYQVERQLFHLDGEDELYWNVTGNDWSFPIEHASVAVHLPAGARPSGIAGYTGSPGQSGGEFRVLEEGPGIIRLETTTTLAPGEGFTIAIGWPEGAVARPTVMERLGHLLAENRGTFAGLILLLVLLAYYVWLWTKLGRDPPAGVVIPLFEAPAGLSPVAAGLVWNRGFSFALSKPRALTILFTDLAAKGILVLEEDEKDGFVVEHTGAGWQGMPEDEKAVLEALFGSGQPARVALGRRYEPRLGKAMLALKNSFGKAFTARWFRNNRGPWLIGALLAALTAIAATTLDARTAGEGAVIVFMLVFVAGFGTPVLLVATSVLRLWRSGGVRSFLGGLFLSLVALAFTVPIAAVLYFLSELVAPPAIAIAALAILVAIAFRSWLETVTEEGRDALAALAGYRLYLSMAEGDRLNQAGRDVEITEALFEAHLPYAMALGVEKEWTGKFSASLARSATDPDAAKAAYRPRWYRGPGTNWRGPDSLTTQLSRNLSRAAGTASSRPASSGGGSGRSGGSSGGGRGGGGGGGW